MKTIDNEDIFRTAVENSNDGVIIISGSKRIFFNRKYLEMLGYDSPEELSDKPVYSIVHPDDLEMVEEYARRRQAGEPSPSKYELRLLRKDGSVLPVEISSTKIVFEGRPASLGFIRDISIQKQFIEKLQYEKHRFSALTENAPFGMALIARDGKFVYLNPKFKEIFGYDLTDIPDGRTWFEKAYPDPEYRSTVVLAWKNDLVAVKPGEKRPRIFNVVCKDGIEKIVNFLPVQLETGEHIMSCQDVTENKRLEIALMKSEERYRTIFENATEGIFQTTPAGRYISINPSFARMFGFSSPQEMIEEVTDIGNQLYVNPEDRERLKDLLLQLGHVEAFEVELYRKDKSKFWVSINVHAVFDSDGTMLYLEGTNEDITKRKAAENALVQSEKKYRSIIDNALNGIYQTTINGKFIMANPAFVNMLGYSSFDELTTLVTDITHQLYVDPESREHIMRILEKEQIIKKFETQFYKKDGSKIWVSINMRSVCDNEGKFLYYEGIDEDITSHKQAEEVLRTSAENLRRALNGTIKAISLTVETRDPYTAGHQKRVSNLARAIAREMNLPGNMVDNIRMAGNIHDIGKISVPAELLSKPTKLTDLELSLIKVHAQSGYDILKDAGLPYPIAEIVLQHHERLDGSGYPNGLMADKILFEAKILSVADVVEAIATHRPYRHALGIDAALSEIEKNKGILYDIAVVDVCIKLFKEGSFKFE